MRTNNYVENLLRRSSEIIIDTSSLMETDRMEMFISEYLSIFNKLDRKILVSKEVCLELVRHLKSSDVEKKTRASRAIMLFKEYPNLFELEDEKLEFSEIGMAFADSKILARLTKNIDEIGQLLITNDKKLGEDAIKLNHLLSVQGNSVMVCYLNSYGGLTYPRAKENTSSPNSLHRVQEESIDTLGETIFPKKVENKLSIFAKSCFWIVVGIGIGKYGKSASNLLKEIM